MATVYEIITERIVTAIETTGVLPWKKPWRTYEGDDGFPKNLITKKAYRGINAFLLSLTSYQSPFWLTYKQALELGGKVKKGEKGVPMVFWNKKEIEDSNSGNTKEVSYLRYYTVFNVDQCDGIDSPTLTELQRSEETRLERCEEIVRGYTDRPEILEGHKEAAYLPIRDVIKMPHRKSFVTAEEFYSTLFHELGHSTGHAKRLGRQEVTTEPVNFGSKSYGKEELVAEMTASFLSAEVGISPATIDNSASYINGWIRTIKGSPKLVIEAASSAQKAADWILKRSRDESSS